MYRCHKGKNRRILVIDDEESMHKTIRSVLGNVKADTVDGTETETAIFGSVLNGPQKPFDIDSAYHGREGFEKVHQSLREGYPYAVAFIDIRMPHGWDGIETVHHIWQEDPRIQIIICTAYSDYTWGGMVDRLGESDKILVLKKPFSNMEIRQMVCSLIQKWNLINNLEDLMRERKVQVAETRDITVFALAKLAESRDPETGNHLERLRSYAQILGKQLARESSYKSVISERFLGDLYRSSPLHDIGKVGVADAILLKPAQLNSIEFEAMKKHTVIGENAIKAAVEQGASGSFLSMGAEIARSHHERFNGSGYPDGLRGEEIALSARIVALADVYDAITSVRTYKSATEPEIAKGIIEAEAGKHFDPVIVDAFCKRWGDFLNVRTLADNGQLETAEHALSGVVKK
ncbi:MAG: response regulator [Planctomycetota bacterium]|jgi:putative two-component system response regulator